VREYGNNPYRKAVQLNLSSSMFVYNQEKTPVVIKMKVDPSDKDRRRIV